jgi:uncharacterized protein
MQRSATPSLSSVPVRWLATRALRVLVLAWIGIFALVYPFQRKLLYMPIGDRTPPEAAGLIGATEDVITTPDGERLISWTSPAKPGHPTILYFHGNAGNIAWRADRFARLQSAGYGVRMIDYRGFGGSTGSPSEPGLIIDATTAYNRMRTEGIAPHNIILFGESLGTGVAVQLAASHPVAAVILDSPYTSTADVGARQYPYLPVRWLMWDQFNSLAYIASIRAPLLIVHGDRDPIVPYQLGSQLFAAASEPKQFLTLPGEGHTVPLDRGAWAAIVPFITRATSKSETATRLQ